MIRPSDDESIEATAAAWLAQRDDVLTPEQAGKFAAWRAADPRHEAAVLRLEGAWAALQPLRDFRPAAARHPDRNLLSRPARRRTIAFPARVIAVAAAVALALSAGWWGLRSAAGPTDPLVYETTIGGYERVMLGDGSVLELNGDTSAEVRFSSAERRVKLVRGEAHFMVAKNPARPFWVEAGGVGVRAVGTAFNVRVGPREIEVLVTEGKVSVAELERVAPAALAAVPDAGSSRGGARVPLPDTFLVANERALITILSSAIFAVPSAPVVDRLSAEAVRDMLAWQGPRLVFVDTPLAEAIRQFNRLNAVQLELADPALATLPIGGSFRPENVEAFVRLLESDNDVAVERSDAARIVLRKTK